MAEKKKINYKEIAESIGQMKALLNDPALYGHEAEAAGALLDFVKNTNKTLFDSDRIILPIGVDTSSFIDPETCVKGFPVWADVISEVTNRHSRLRYNDLLFEQYVDYTKLVPHEIRKANAIASFFSQELNVQCTDAYYINLNPGIYGTLHPEKDDYNAFDQRLSSLERNIDEFRILYDLLADVRSKLTLAEILWCWYDSGFYRMQRIREAAFDSYFDHDIIAPCSEEVFVDAGGFNGDTVLSFAENYSEWSKIITYEIMPSLCREIENSTAALPNIEVRNKGLGEEKTVMFTEDGTGSTGALKNEGATEVEVVRLDDDLPGKVTWIKMDIEGAETSAMKGCERHIKEDAPVLTICTYHNYDDIVGIPKLIRSMRDDYTYYFRSNNDVPVPSEFVIICVPKDRLVK